MGGFGKCLEGGVWDLRTHWALEFEKGGEGTIWGRGKMGGGIMAEFVSVKCHPCLLGALPPPLPLPWEVE